MSEEITEESKIFYPHLKKKLACQCWRFLYFVFCIDNMIIFVNSLLQNNQVV